MLEAITIELQKGVEIMTRINKITAILGEVEEFKFTIL
jgi:hypothetical protein